MARGRTIFKICILFKCKIPRRKAKPRVVVRTLIPWCRASTIYLYKAGSGIAQNKNYFDKEFLKGLYTRIPSRDCLMEANIFQNGNPALEKI